MDKIRLYNLTVVMDNNGTEVVVSQNYYHADSDEQAVQVGRDSVFGICYDNKMQLQAYAIKVVEFGRKPDSGVVLGGGVLFEHAEPPQQQSQPRRDKITAAKAAALVEEAACENDSSAEDCENNDDEDDELIEAFRSDAIDLRRIAALLRLGDIKQAYKEAKSLDTMVRESVPDKVWEFMEGQQT